MKIDFLQWDTDFFNLKTGAIYLDEAASNPADIIEKAKQGGYQLVYVFSKEPQLEYALAGLNLVDTKVFFSKEVAETEAPIQLTKHEGEASPELTELALQSGWKSRFNVDPKLNMRYKDLYALWLTRSLSGEFADAVFTYNIGDETVGLVSARLEEENLAKVGLFAIADTHRGKGLGKKMLAALESWYYKQGAKTSEIATQLDNEVACKLYKSSGYRVVNTSYVYHLHL